MQESNGNYDVPAAEPLRPVLVSVILGRRSVGGAMGMAVLFQTRACLVQCLFSHKGHTWMSGED